MDFDGKLTRLLGQASIVTNPEREQMIRDDCRWSSGNLDAPGIYRAESARYADSQTFSKC